MAGDAHGAETQEELQAPQDNGCEQASQNEPQASGVDWEKAIAERDGRIAELEQQVAEAAKNAETAEELRSQIAELKAQGESDRIDFQLRLAGVRNVKAARAVLADHGGDVDALTRKLSRGCSRTLLLPSRSPARPGSPTQAPARTQARP